MINIGQYIEVAINWTMVHFSTFFDAVNAGIGSFIIGFQHILFGIPFYITILILAALAWMKAGRGTAIFTALGLLLIYGMGFWEATMQTLALVLSSTCLALIVGVPLGVWTANSPRAEKILRPVLDLTTPASTVSKPKLSIILYPAQPKKLAENCERAKRIAKLPIVNINTFGVLPLFSVVIRKASNSEAPREKSRAGIVASLQ